MEIFIVMSSIAVTACFIAFCLIQPEIKITFKKEIITKDLTEHPAPVVFDPTSILEEETDAERDKVNKILGQDVESILSAVNGVLSGDAKGANSFGKDLYNDIPGNDN